MPEDLIRYDILAQDALRGVVRKVLAEVAKTGLPGEHHFYVTFETRAPGVRISSRMLAQYPEEMTVVLQHQFWDLSVTEHAFEVGLSFNGVPERLLVPFTAVKSFVDPSVQFGLQFESAPAEEGAEDASSEMEAVETSALVLDQPAASAEPDAEPEKPGEAQIVRLDAFRKKN
ncbi:MAG TPA: ClpXP protease specificity-enhancing factor SspB [Kaistia sp.]|nr:ClpXP protease specificity-enhancing factor SspB [Kaistia sp.]